jgi:predicted nucleotidyltransferase component of viral defense system
MKNKPTNLPASVGARLRNLARAQGMNLDLILRRYALERLLLRLSLSPHRHRFVLKGAMLFTAWLSDPFRPTQDLDLPGFGDPAVQAVAKKRAHSAKITSCVSNSFSNAGMSVYERARKCPAVRAPQPIW